MLDYFSFLFMVIWWWSNVNVTKRRDIIWNGSASDSWEYFSFQSCNGYSRSRIELHLILHTNQQFQLSTVWIIKNEKNTALVGGWLERNFLKKLSTKSTQNFSKHKSKNFDKKNVRQKKFRQKKFSTKKFLTKKIFDKKNFRHKNFRQKFFDKNFFDW